jgi:spore photoproduct lyase
LDPLTAYSTVLVPFFAEHPYARLTLLTKSNNVDRLINLEHQGHTILSWSVNPPEVCCIFEENVPSAEERVESMRKVASAGYPVRAVMMPIIPVERWQKIYAEFTWYLLDSVPLQRLTLGGICSYKAARALMESKLGSRNPISADLENVPSPDGRSRYTASLRNEIYTHIIKVAKDIRPDLEIALCLEEENLWKSSGLENNRGRCNCVL